MKTYLIAGGAGFLGCHLVENLLKNNFRVVVIDDFSTGCTENLENVKGNENLSLIKHDIIHPFEIEEDIDTVFHLASIANPVQYELKPLKTLQSNSRGTENLLEFAINNNADFIYFSSSEIYGNHIPLPIGGLKESTATHLNILQKRSPYPVAKMFGEELVRATCNEQCLKYIILRPFNIYGGGIDIHTSYGRVIPNFIRWALTKNPLKINGDGHQTRSFLHISDFITFMDKLISIDMTRINKHVINVGEPNEISILDLALKINVLTGNTTGVTFQDGYDYEPKFRAPNIDFAMNELDWRPRTSLDEGLLETISYFRRNREWIKAD